MLTSKILTAIFILELVLASMWGRRLPPNERKPLFTISKKTTYVMGPVDKQGYIDYVTALNKELSKGITPKNNANVLLWRAMGPHPENATMSPEFFKWLGKKPPEKGKYFVSIYKYGNPKHWTYEKRDKLADRLHDHAMLRPWTPKEFPAIAKWLAANKTPLELVTQASQRTHYYNPLIPPKDKSGNWRSLVDALLPGVQITRELGQALVARAMLRIGQKRYRDAWEDLQTCHRVGPLVSNGGTLIEYLVGNAIDNTAVEADLVYLEKAKLNTKKLKSHLQDLQKLPTFPNPSRNFGLTERFVILQFVMSVDRGTALDNGVGANTKSRPLRGVVNWDAGLKKFNLWFDRHVAAVKMADHNAREKQLDLLEHEMKARFAKTQGGLQLLRFLQSPSERGEELVSIFTGLLMPSFRRVLEAQDRLRQRHRNLQVAFALEIYHLDKGKYPTKLDALTPNYLNKIPLDFFTGMGLIYRRTKDGYLLYSVGRNRIDDRGRTTSDEPPADDLVIRMPNTTSRK